MDTLKESQSLAAQNNIGIFANKISEDLEVLAKISKIVPHLSEINQMPDFSGFPVKNSVYKNLTTKFNNQNLNNNEEI